MDDWLKIGWYQKHQIEALVKNFSVNLFGLLEATTGGVFCKKGILRNFAKFTGKHLCQSLFFNKVAGVTYMLLIFMSKKIVHGKQKQPFFVFC